MVAAPAVPIVAKGLLVMGFLRSSGDCTPATRVIAWTPWTFTTARRPPRWHLPPHYLRDCRRRCSRRKNPGRRPHEALAARCGDGDSRLAGRRRADRFRITEKHLAHGAALEPRDPRPDLDQRLHEPQPRLHDLRHTVRHRRKKPDQAADGGVVDEIGRAH